MSHKTPVEFGVQGYVNFKVFLNTTERLQQIMHKRSSRIWCSEEMLTLKCSLTRPDA